MGKKKSKVAVTAPRQGVVVFGLDEHEKPRAAYFDARQADFAVKVADALGYQVLRTWSADQAELISSLPAGRVYASGQGIVPAVRRKVFKKIAELAAATGGTEDRTKAESFGPQPADLGAAALSKDRKSTR